MTVWSGAVLVTMIVPEVVIGLPLIEIPVPPDSAIEVIVPTDQLL